MRIRRRLQLLRVYAVVNTVVLSVLGLTAFSAGPKRARFEEIDVERINVVEKGARVRLVIANRARSPGVVLNGKMYSQPGNRTGLIFYNDEGVENGGLIFGGRKENGGYWSSGSLTFDQYNQDQVVALPHIDENGRRFQGLTVLDRPDVPLWELLDRDEAINKMPEGPQKEAARQEWPAMQGGVRYAARGLFVGRGRGGAAIVSLADRAGKVRLRLQVDSLGAASLQFLDQEGRITDSLPDSVRPGSNREER